MEPNIEEVAGRIRALREDMGLTMQEMADATGRSVSEYAAQESGEQDLSFTFLYKCAQRLGVDVIELLTGEDPHLSGYSLVRAAEGLSIQRRAGFEYLHKAPHFKNKLAEPFLVTAPYLEEEQTRPIHLSYHEGQELDFVISGKMRFAYEGHVEELEAGDLLMYDSGRGHGMIATGGEPCVGDYLGACVPAAPFRAKRRGRMRLFPFRRHHPPRGGPARRSLRERAASHAYHEEHSSALRPRTL